VNHISPVDVVDFNKEKKMAVVTSWSQFLFQLIAFGSFAWVRPLVLYIYILHDVCFKLCDDVTKQSSL